MGQCLSAGAEGKHSDDRKDDVDKVQVEAAIQNETLTTDKAEQQKAIIGPQRQLPQSPGGDAVIQLHSTGQKTPSQSPKKKIFTSVLDTDAAQQNAVSQQSLSSRNIPRGSRRSSIGDDFTLGHAFNPLSRHIPTPRDAFHEVLLPQFELIDLTDDGQTGDPLTGGDNQHQQQEHESRTSSGLLAPVVVSINFQSQIGNNSFSRTSGNHEAIPRSPRERPSLVAFDLVYVSSDGGGTSHTVEPLELTSPHSVVSSEPLHRRSVLGKNPSLDGSGDTTTSQKSVDGDGCLVVAPFPNAAAVGVPHVHSRHRDNVARSPKVGPISSRPSIDEDDALRL